MNLKTSETFWPALETEFGPRLVTLCDGRPGLRTTIPVETRSPSAAELANQKSETQNSTVRDNSCNPCLDFIASDETLDRYGEIISVSGWQLDTYRRNPVFQNAHQYGDIIFTLGKALITEIREVGRVTPCAPSGFALFQRIEFAVDVNPMARIAYGLYHGKFLKAVSAGFIPVRWEDCPPGGTSSASPQSTPRRRYLEQELVEVSAVAIPANPNALALALKSGAVETTDLRALADLLAQTLCKPLAIGPNLHPATFNMQPSLQLLRLAQHLREILRHT
jgi:hypothetical protein